MGSQLSDMTQRLSSTNVYLYKVVTPRLGSSKQWFCSLWSLELYVASHPSDHMPVFGWICDSCGCSQLLHLSAQDFLRAPRGGQWGNTVQGRCGGYRACSVQTCSWAVSHRLVNTLTPDTDSTQKTAEERSLDASEWLDSWAHLLIWKTCDLAMSVCAASCMCECMPCLSV